MTGVFSFVLLGSLAGAAFFRSRGSRIPAWIVAGLALLAAVSLQARCSRIREGLPSVGSVSFFTAAGANLGQAVAETCPAGGTILVFYPHGDGAKGWRGWAEAHVEGLRKHLAEARYPFALVQASAPPGEGEMAAVSEAELNGALRGHRDVAAVVLMKCLPRGRRPAAGLPLFLLGDQPSEAVAQLVEKGTVRAAVLTRADADWLTQPACWTSLERLFALRYERLTAP